MIMMFNHPNVKGASDITPDKSLVIDHHPTPTKTQTWPNQRKDGTESITPFPPPQLGRKAPPPPAGPSNDPPSAVT